MAPFLRCAAGLLLLTACANAPLGAPPVTFELSLDNPERLALAVDVVEGDQCRRLASVGSAPRLQLQLLPGMYVVRATTGHGEVALPAPLLAAALPGRRLNLVVTTPPAVDAEFTFVPAGPALVGDALGIGQEDERPVRIEDVASFWLARREVTNAEFAVFLTAVGADVDPAWCAFDSRKCRLHRGGASATWTTTAPTLPIATVSLAGARAYCAWRTRVTGVHHRLPTEVEWEKAARGPASFVFAYGNVYRRGAANQESGELRPVAQGAATGFGVFDMTGNVFEWTDDSWRSRPDGEPEVAFQVLRGGSFVLDGMYLRNSFRMKQRPGVRTDDIGFRVVRDVAAGGNP
jgi:formylglycine-generating enzyme required for sulfatase activity